MFKMANFNLNKVILGGRMVRDPELRQTSSGIPVTSFSIAVNRKYTSQHDSATGGPTADFINVVAWRSQAEFVCKYFRKGSSICVVGSIQTRSWEDKNGQKQYGTDVVADEINFVDSKNENPASGYTQTSYAAPSFSSGEGEAPKFEEISNDDDLPF